MPNERATNRAMRLPLLVDRRRVILAGGAAMLAPSAARSQTLLTRPVRMILPLSAGSTVDVAARHVAEPMSRALGQPIVIDNRPGAGGVNGTGEIVRAEPDGATVGMVSSNHVINPGVYRSIPFDSIEDITPISIVASAPILLVAHPSVPATNLRELVAHARANPGVLNYGSPGSGTVPHLAMVLLLVETGIRMEHVAYRGSGQQITDIVAGHTPLGFMSVTIAAPHIRAGRMRPIGVATTARVSLVPDVPTLAESGAPNYRFDPWIALIGPPRLPEPIVALYHRAVRTALDDPHLRDLFAAQALTAIGTSPDEARAFFRSELAKHLDLTRRAGIVPE
jgi:tripartite-type tricarboxylate transporter receptor subunit TctC